MSSDAPTVDTASHRSDDLLVPVAEEGRNDRKRSRDRTTSPKLRPAPSNEVAERIATELQEKDRELMESVVEHLGVEQALQVLSETRDVLAKGGMLVPDGSRKRTPGGTFLTLVQERVTPEERKSIWACQTARRKKRADQKTRNKVAEALKEMGADAAGA